jgi:hypothetical protein
MDAIVHQVRLIYQQFVARVEKFRAGRKIFCLIPSVTVSFIFETTGEA